MKKIFLIGSCRIHRPFNCDNKHEYGEFNLYDCLNTKWYEKYFLGSLYCSNYINQTLNYLINRDLKNKNNIEVMDPQIKLDENHFLKLCENLYESDIIIIEIATLKYLKNISGFYISQEHNPKITPIFTITEEELINNIKIIENLIEGIGKKVLFISHFNLNNINNRNTIINCLKKTAKYFFDPTTVIINSKQLSDINHYNFETEKIIMKKIHEYLSDM